MHAAATAIRIAPLPTLSPKNISWRTLASGQVEFSVIIHNDHATTTDPADLIFAVAPLGAFVDPHPIARLAVKGLSPGERQRLTLRVARDALPSFPVEQDWRRKLALGGGGARPPDFPQDPRRQKARQRFAYDPSSDPEVPDPDDNDYVDPAAFDFDSLNFDLSFLLGKDKTDKKSLSSTQWIGNVNIWFDRAPSSEVEVHLAKDVQVTAGRSVALSLFLPSGSRYDISLACSNPSWRAELVNAGTTSLLVVHAPEQRGSRAEVTVNATRRADGKTVPVEFTFEAVYGRSTTVGCVTL